MEFIVIDDSPFDLFTQEKLLLKSGLTSKVHGFLSPMQALDYLHSRTEILLDTVILLDLQMPGLNGFEFTEQFALLPENVKKKIRLFMISSTVDHADIQEAKSNPYIIELLSKPLEIPVLKSLLSGNG